MNWQVSKFMLLVFVCGHVQAQTYSIPSKEIGRIFSNPNARTRPVKTEPVTASVSNLVPEKNNEDIVVALSSGAQQTASVALVLLGYAKQANGSVGLWLTQELDRRTYYLEVPAKDLDEKAHEVDIVYEGVRVKLKPGQVFMVDKARITELYATYHEE